MSGSTNYERRGRQLAGFQSLAGLTPDALRWLTEHSRVRAFQRGQVLFLEGDAADWMGLVISGRVKIVRASHGGRSLTLEVIRPGEIFGFPPVKAGSVYPATAVGHVPGHVLEVPRPTLRELLRQFPALEERFMETVVARMRRLHDKAVQLSTRRVEDRVAAVLIEMTLRECAEGKRDLEITAAEIAEQAGTTVETALRVLGKWSKAGIIAHRRGRVAVLAPAALQGLASPT